jgi:hypothetical protein
MYWTVISKRGRGRGRGRETPHHKRNKAADAAKVICPLKFFLCFYF